MARRKGNKRSDESDRSDDRGHNDHDHHGSHESGGSRIGRGESIRGSRGDDVLFGGAGNDKLKGGRGDDILDGGAGNDKLNGGRGDDTLDGGAGNDKLKGGRGDDTLDGGAGNDKLNGGLGDDVLIFDVSENEGSQSRYDGGNGSDTVRIKLTAGRYEELREELATLKGWMSDNADSTNSGGPSFETTFGLTLRNLENLEVYVDGYGLVDPTNVPPSVTDEEVRIDEDGVATVDVLANDSDPDGDVLNIARVGDAIDSDGNVVGTVQVTGGQIEFTPNADWSGTATISYVVDDGNGGGPEGFGIDARTGTLTVVVNAIADVPTLMVVDAEGDENTAIALDIQSMLNDLDGSENLKVVLAGVPAGASLSAGTLNQDGTWSLTAANLAGLTITPAANSDADFSLTVTATSTEISNGDQASVSQTLNVVVNSANDAPTAGPDFTLTVNEDSGDTVLGIAAPVDGDGDDLTITVTGLPDEMSGGIYKADGTAVLAGAILTAAELTTLVFRTVTDADGGAGNFTYEVSDGQVSVSRTITLDITPANDAPTLIVPEFENDGQLFAADEFQVNSTTFVDLNQSSIATLADGSFVIVWAAEVSNILRWDIYGQRFDSNGNEIGEEFVANFFRTNVQNDPHVSATPDGGFVVTWTSHGQIGFASDIIGQRFDASGTKIDSTFIANGPKDVGQQLSTVTVLEDGGYVVTWTRGETTVTLNAIYGQRYDIDGAEAGGRFRINTSNLLDQQHSSVAALKDGGFVVTWESNNQDGSPWSIFGQRFDADGNMVGGEFAVNSYTDMTQDESVVTGLPDGGFIVTWVSEGQDGDGSGIFAQRYDASGATVGTEFQVNTYTASDQTTPTVTALNDGGYVIIWESRDQDGGAEGIYGQRYDVAGNPFEGEFQVNSVTGPKHRKPEISALQDGGFVVTWNSLDQTGHSLGLNSKIYHGADSGVREEVPFAIEGVSIGDVDAGDGLMTVTIVAANGGLTVSGEVPGGVGAGDISGNGTGTIVLTGTVSAINATLAEAGGLVYRGDTDFFGTEFVTVTVEDNGNSGSGGSLSETQLIEFFVSSVVDIKGTAGDDTLTGGAGDEQITGFEGNDMLIGGAGDDMFIFGSGDGADIIGDFGDGADVLDLSGVAGLATFDDVMSSATQIGADTVLDFGGGDQITLIGVDKISLLASDFVL